MIVGGGPAGISLALHLQREAPALAERTVVLERAHYPRDKYCAGAVGQRGLMCLDAIGARPDVPAVPIEGIAFAFGGHTQTVRLPALGSVVRRLEFDDALARIAIGRGIVVRQGAEVRGIELGGSGARVHLAGGEVLETRAVAGADGVRGVTRRTTGFSRGRLRAQVVELDTELAAGDLPHDTLLFDFSDRNVTGYVWDFPTLVDGRPLMCRGAYLVGGDAMGPRAHLAQHLARKGLDIGRYRLKPFAERGLDRSEPIARPHLLLVGEAAGIDIATGEGIPQALAFGALAARYLADSFHKGDLRFQDWGRLLLAAREGRLVRHRHFAARYLFSSERPQLERLGRLNPALMEIGVRRFAGLPTPLPLAMKAALALLPWSVTGAPWRCARAGKSRVSEEPADPTESRSPLVPCVPSPSPLPPVPLCPLCPLPPLLPRPLLPSVPLAPLAGRGLGRGVSGVPPRAMTLHRAVSVLRSHLAFLDTDCVARSRHRTWHRRPLSLTLSPADGARGPERASPGQHAQPARASQRARFRCDALRRRSSPTCRYRAWHGFPDRS